MIQVNDKVKLMSLGFSHAQTIGFGNTKVHFQELQKVFDVQSLSGDGFYVNGGHYYDERDVYKHYTPKEDPEMFL